MIKEIEELFNKQSLEEEIYDILKDWSPKEPGDKDQLLGWIEIEYETLFHNLEHIHEKKDVENTLKCRYLELKAKWFQLNNRIQYGMIMGDTNMVLNYKSTLLSLLMSHFENVLNHDTTENIQFILNSLIDETEVNENININMEEQLLDLYEDKKLLTEKLGYSDPIEIIDEIDKLRERNKILEEKLKDLDDESIEIRFENEKMVIYGPQKIFVNKKKNQ